MLSFKLREGKTFYHRYNEMKTISNSLNIIVTQSCVLSNAWFRDLKIELWGLKIKINFLSGKLHTLFPLNYVNSAGAISHNQQLSIACYQVSFYANSYFE